MAKIKFSMAARCEAAGRPGNEDNFQLSDDLSDEKWEFTTDKEIILKSKGALLVVADGMGGMNAGEVASALAIETVKDRFSSEKLTDEIISSSDSIKKYIEKVIIEADKRIKDDARVNEKKKGMGTTLVLAWIIGEKVFIGWCGDSRAYRFNPQEGLEPLSRDHSYVQELIDAGKLKEEFAFDHPDSNIVTRSLGDPRGKAKPEVNEYLLRNDDIILLCSDGLSGVLRDHEIEEIIRNNSTSAGACRDALWNAAREAGWDDNVTIGLCRIVSGCRYNAEKGDRQIEEGNRQRRKTTKRIVALLIVFIAILGGLGGFYLRHQWDNNNQSCLKPVPDINDSIRINTTDSLSGEQPPIGEKLIDKIKKKNQKPLNSQKANSKDSVNKDPKLTPIWEHGTVTGEDQQ